MSYVVVVQGHGQDSLVVTLLDSQTEGSGFDPQCLRCL